MRNGGKEMDKVKKVVIDIVKSLVVGMGVGLIIATIFSIIGLIVNKGSIKEALSFVRTAVLLIGSIGLFFSAGIFLKRDGQRAMDNKEGWKNHFKILNIGYVLFIICIGVIIIGGSADYLTYII